MEVYFVLFLCSSRVNPTFMCKLARLYTANMLQLETNSLGSNLYQLSFKQEGQLDEPGYSCDTRRILSKLEEAHGIKAIFIAVRKFYVASILKIQKSLFRDSWLKDLGTLQPERTASYL